MSRRLATLALLNALSGCGGCGDPAPPGPPAALDKPAPESWTFGAVPAEQTVVLPPPCGQRDSPLRAVLVRDIRFSAVGSRLGELWAAEGTADREGGWHPDASGVVVMAHGPSRASPAPWPARGEPVATIDRGNWRVAYDFDAGAGPQLAMWRAGERELLGAGITAVDLSCRGERCALLVRGADAGVEAWLGAAAEPAALWQRTSLGRSSEPFGLEVLGDAVVTLMARTDHLDFVTVAAGEPPAPRASVRISGPPIAALVEPPLVMTPAPHRLVDGCASEGGVRIERPDGPGAHLRSAEPPIPGSRGRGALLRLQRGYLATWLAPHRCASRRHLLYAVMLGEDGAPLAPVTAVGLADDFAAASSGADVELWLHDAAERTLTWVRARCVL